MGVWGISLFTVTHEHRDHVDISALKVILSNNTAPVLTNAGVAALLAKEGIDAVVMKDSGYCAGDITLRAITARHEKNFLLRSPVNNAYIANDVFLHPGDSLSTSLYANSSIKILAMPAAASWANHMQIVKFAVAMKPKIIIPIHDGFIKDFYLEAKYNQYQKYFAERDISFRPLREPGEFVEVEV